MRLAAQRRVVQEQRKLSEVAALLSEANISWGRCSQTVPHMKPASRRIRAVARPAPGLHIAADQPADAAKSKP